MLLMWSVMMVGMMTPSVAPMILVYARVARQASSRGMALAPSGWFALGYFLAWSGFALVATLLQWGLERALLLSPASANVEPRLGGALLIAAGLYQWSPLKNACLSQCQSPFAFIQKHGGFRGKSGSSVRGRALVASRLRSQRLCSSSTACSIARRTAHQPMVPWEWNTDRHPFCGIGGIVDRLAAVHARIARTTRTCTSDRAALGHSDPSPHPQHAKNTTADLEAALQVARVSGPYVLVGHSLGSAETLTCRRPIPSEALHGSLPE